MAAHLHRDRVQPRSTIRASSACTSGASGVVRDARHDLVADARLDRADQAGPVARRPQPGLEQERRGRLAVGARDAERAAAGSAGWPYTRRRQPEHRRGSATTSDRQRRGRHRGRRPAGSVSDGGRPAGRGLGGRSRAPWVWLRAARRRGRRAGRGESRRVTPVTGDVGQVAVEPRSADARGWRRSRRTPARRHAQATGTAGRLRGHGA